jgi:hypothetical protein
MVVLDLSRSRAKSRHGVCRLYKLLSIPINELVLGRGWVESTPLGSGVESVVMVFGPHVRDCSRQAG